MKPTDILETFVIFAEHQKHVRGLAQFGSYARKEQTTLSDLDLVLIIEEKCSIEETLQDLLESLTGKPWAVLHPKTNKWVLFFGEKIQKVDLFIIQDLKEIEKYFRNSKIRSASDSILVDKDGKLQHLFKVEEIDPEGSDLLALTNITIDKFLDCFDHAIYYTKKKDSYLFYFNYSIALFHIAELMQVELGDDFLLYSPRNLLNRISPLRKDQLSGLSTGINRNDELVYLHKMSEIFLDLCQEISEQQSGLRWNRLSLEMFFKKHFAGLDKASDAGNDSLR